MPTRKESVNRVTEPALSALDREIIIVLHVIHFTFFMSTHVHRYVPLAYLAILALENVNGVRKGVRTVMKMLIQL